jgi:tetratricopeptide (TPR) repeat protein
MDKFEVINYNYGVIYQLRSNFSNFCSKDKERVVSSSQSQVNLVSQDNIDMVLAESYYHLGQLDKAQVALMTFLLKDATNYKANFLRFLIAKKQGDTKQAKERLGELIFLYPESPDPYIELIKCLLQDKEYKASSRLLSVVSKLKTLSPQNKLEIERLSSVCSSCRE